jgi:HAD superfamily hydrolase (TIGR01509 family)
MPRERHPAILGQMIRAVVFDLDGVLLDSEQLWDEARREVVARHHGRWRTQATVDMQGMSAPEWSRYLQDELAVDLPPGRIDDLVVENLLESYERRLPLLPGAVESVRRIGARWPLAVASSANRSVIDKALDLAGIGDLFSVIVSSEEVARGKPEPDVYLEAVDRLGQPSRTCVAIEDSANGIRSAVAAGLMVVAVPNEHYPPPDRVLRKAQLVIGSLLDLTTDALDRLGRARNDSLEQRLDEAEIESFPASDPHVDWSGPPN